ncbi:hypothetical protein SDJN02_03182, partial [Cucurbita argyrosperma subsp. argyrosperma]
MSIDNGGKAGKEYVGSRVEPNLRCHSAKKPPSTSIVAVAPLCQDPPCFIPLPVLFDGILDLHCRLPSPRSRVTAVAA